jgi:uncharacterized repeat protein (TIGR01451 family)
MKPISFRINATLSAAFATGVIISMLTFLVLPGVQSASADKKEDNKVRICHRTNSISNPYKSEEVDLSATGGPDHTTHTGPVFDPDATYPAPHNGDQWGDIIKDGLNWEEGEEIWGNDCKVAGIGPVLKLKKKVKNDWNDAIPSDFSATIDNNGAETTVQLSADWVEYPIEPGSFTVTEEPMLGYELKKASKECASEDAGDGEVFECTLENEDLPPVPGCTDPTAKNYNALATQDDESCTYPEGTLTVTKTIKNAPEGVDATDFSFQVNEESAVGFEASGIAVANFNAGLVVTVVEPEANGEGYLTSYQNCEDVTIIDEGNVTCEITNTYAGEDQGFLIVRKVVKDADGEIVSEADYTQFTFSVGDGSPQPFESDGENSQVLTEGQYTIVEAADSGYSVTYGGSDDDCNELGVVEIVAGDTAYCTITNTEKDEGGGNDYIDLELTKEVDDNTVVENQTITYTVKVTNVGNISVSGVFVTDALPAELEYQSSVPTHGSYDENTNIWTVGTLDANETAQLDMKVKVLVDEGTITNEALADIDPEFEVEEESNTENNFASVDVTARRESSGGGGGRSSTRTQSEPSPTPEQEVLGASTTTLPETGAGDVERAMLSLFAGMFSSGLVLVGSGIRKYRGAGTRI